MEVPLVTLGDPEFAKQDWNTTLINVGVLQSDTQVAGIVRFQARADAGLHGMAGQPNEEAGVKSTII